LIKNADRVGEITPEIEKRLDSLLTLRSSEDELENEGVGRRKKRRSGSLNSKSNSKQANQHTFFVVLELESFFSWLFAFTICSHLCFVTLHDTTPF
jgi:hypothetical protein